MELKNVFEVNADCITIKHLLLMFDLLDYWSDALLQYRILDQALQYIYNSFLKSYIHFILSTTHIDECQYLLTSKAIGNK